MKTILRFCMSKVNEITVLLNHSNIRGKNKSQIIKEIFMTLFGVILALSFMSFLIIHKQNDDKTVMLDLEKNNSRFVDTSDDDDYKGSKYDRGHLAPCADMLWSKVAMDESFFYSNMSPQFPSFNRGIWAKLETLVRKWAIKYDSLYIVTGPVLEKGLPTIGKNEVSIPKYYYKVILNYSSQNTKGIGFIMPNEGSDQPLQNFAVSIDSVQNFTGVNFYYNIPDKTHEENIERAVCIDCWIWK